MNSASTDTGDESDQLPSEDPEGISVGRPATAAAGPKAVAVSLRETIGQAGVSRSARTLLTLNQAGGVDCPGCAWPDPEPVKHRKRAEFCENGAKAVADVATRKKIGREFFAEHSVEYLRQQTEHWLGKQGRLTEPVIRRRGDSHYRPITWDDAIELFATTVAGLGSPNRASYYTSGKASNEVAFLFQLMARCLGTNNLPDCSNMCHESTTFALGDSLGFRKGTVSLDDLTAADLILVVGQNPGTNHPRMLSSLSDAADNGATIVAVNPLPEAGLLAFKDPQKLGGWIGNGNPLAKVHLPIRLGGDLALFNALSRLVIDADRRDGGGVLDIDFIGRYTNGFDEMATHLDQLDWDDVDLATGLKRAQIEDLANRYMSADRVIVCWAVGLTQHRDAVAAIRAVVNFLMLRGNLGREGAGLCPVRGHSNVQGDRTMGVWERPPAAFIDNLDRTFGMKFPREHGLGVGKTITAARDGELDVLVSMGGNLLAASPDTHVARQAFDNLKLNVQISTKLNRSHLADPEISIILPSMGRTDKAITSAGAQFVTVEDSMGWVQSSRGRLDPPGPEVRHEVAIVCALADAVLKASVSEADLPWSEWADNHDLVRDVIEQTIPGFERFNERVREPGGFALPNPVRDSRTFPTPTGTAAFTVNTFEPTRLEAGQLLLQSLRSHDQFNSTTYGLNDRYRGIHGGRMVVFVNPEDLAARGLSDGDIVDITSIAVDGSERTAHGYRCVAYPTPRDCAATYFPEANVLIPIDSFADVSLQPTSKSIVVRLDPAPTSS